MASLQSDNLSLHFPKQKSWSGFGDLYNYEGFWYHSPFLEGTVAAQHNFKAKSTDIIVASHLKTGTTWLKALCFAIATRSLCTSPLLSKMPHDCIPFLEFDLSSDSPNRDNQTPLISTHIPFDSLPNSVIESGCKIVYIWRDPKDVFVSLWHFVLKVEKSMGIVQPPVEIEEAFEEFCRGVSFYGPYWEHVLGYWKAKVEFPERVMFLKYEEMKKHTRFYVVKLAEFIGFPFSVDEEEKGVVEKIIEMCSFESLSNLEVNRRGKHRANTAQAVDNNVYFRKGEIGDWKNELTFEMAARLDSITEEKFRGSGLLEDNTSVFHSM